MTSRRAAALKAWETRRRGGRAAPKLGYGSSARRRVIAMIGRLNAPLPRLRATSSYKRFSKNLNWDYSLRGLAPMGKWRG